MLLELLKNRRPRLFGVKEAVIKKLYRVNNITVLFVCIVCVTSCASLEVLFNSPESGNNSEGPGRNNSKGTVQTYNGSRVNSPRPPAALNTGTKSDAELIAEAIAWGDCAFLYDYTQQEGADKNLSTQANNTIKRYTAFDTITAKYQTEKMDSRVRRVSKELMEQIFIDPAASLPGVVAALINDVSDQFLKTKILHDWICDNIAYDSDMYFSGRITSQDYVTVLKRKKRSVRDIPIL